MVNSSGLEVARTTMLSGTFQTREDAERAFEALQKRGYSKDEIGIVMSEETRNRHFNVVTADTPLGTRAAEGGAASAAIGGVTGVIVGLLASATMIALPGIGIVFAGPLVAGLVGLGAGGAAGGVLGTLIGVGIPEEHARLYETEIKDGKIVLTVTPHSEEDSNAITKEWTGVDTGAGVVV